MAFSLFPAKQQQGSINNLPASLFSLRYNPFGNPDGTPIDYEEAAKNLQLPKDFSKFLK